MPIVNLLLNVYVSVNIHLVTILPINTLLLQRYATLDRRFLTG